MNNTTSPEHVHRPDAFSPARRYRLESDGLHWDTVEGQRGRLAFDELQSCQLRFAPTRFATRRYEMKLGSRQGTALTLSNMHFEGLSRFEERSASYRALVLAWLAALQQARPDLSVQFGNPPVRHRLYQGLAIVLLIVLALAAVTMIATGLWGLALIKLALVAMMLPLLWRYLERNRPQEATPGTIPEGVLPPAS